RRKIVITPRFLVPADTKSAEIAITQTQLKDGPTRRGPALVDEPGQAGVARRKEELFKEAMLENSSTRPPRRLRDFVISATVQILFLAALLLLPLYFTEALDIHQFNKTLIAAPPPAPAPAPPPGLTRSAAPKRRAAPITVKLLVPRVIPNKVARLSEDRAGNDLAAAIDPGEGVPSGVPGGLPGGVPGGVIGGVPSNVAPPAPIVSAPRTPIRVGGGVKAPRLISGPEPVFPVLARQAKIAGAVVIDAVIDTQGNVVEMKTVSGPQILALAAMEALRQWKYEPTILGGEAIPVRLLVTITFEQHHS
ncbi:MAG TPA: energy transducer TonB, partial [Terriglobales bacterium]|nr:energy transducer TonB [Terriglobales bacterium]